MISLPPPHRLFIHPATRPTLHRPWGIPPTKHSSPQPHSLGNQKVWAPLAQARGSATMLVGSEAGQFKQTSTRAGSVRRPFELDEQRALLEEKVLIVQRIAAAVRHSLPLGREMDGGRR